MSLMRWLWDIGAIIGAVCLLYAMVKVDLWINGNKGWLLHFRIWAFIAEAVLIVWSVADNTWKPDIPAALTLWGGVLIVWSNAVSLYIRACEQKRENVPSPLDAD